MTIFQVPTGARRHLVRFQNPSAPGPDGDGGALVTWADCDPAYWRVSLEPLPANQERAEAGTVISTATLVVLGYRHPQVSTRSRLIYKGTTYHVLSLEDLEQRGVRMRLTVQEVQEGGP